LLLARPLAGVSADGPGYVAELSDGTLIRGRAVLLASGVEWRRLDVPGVDGLLGAGVCYGAGPSEALACTGSRVVVVGGGNSAGQAVVRFSRYARQVTLLVRGRDLGASMSQYLIDHLSGIPNVEAARAYPRTGPAARRPRPRLPRRGRVEAGQGKMPEREPHVPPESPSDVLDRAEHLPRVRALVIAVLDDQTAGRRTPDVIDLLIQRRQRSARRQARIWRTTLRPGKVLVPPLVLGMHGPGGHGDRAGHIAGRRHYAVPGDLAEDAPDRDEPPHAPVLQPDLGSRT